MNKLVFVFCLFLFVFLYVVGFATGYDKGLNEGICETSFNVLSNPYQANPNALDEINSKLFVELIEV